MRKMSYVHLQKSRYALWLYFAGTFGYTNFASFKQRNVRYAWKSGAQCQTNECDVLIAVGMRFDDRVTGKLDTYAKQAKVIHLDIDHSEIDKNVKVDVPVLGNL